MKKIIFSSICFEIKFSILFFLTACSYDPYHYYYDCEAVNSQGVKTGGLFYRHDKIVNWMGIKFEFVRETETLILYESPSLKSETISAALLKLSKVDDSVVFDLLHDRSYICKF